MFDGPKEALFTHKDFDTFHLDYPTPMKVLNHLHNTLGYPKKLVLSNEELLKHLKEVQE